VAARARADERIGKALLYNGGRFAEAAENAKYAFDFVGGRFRGIGFKNVAFDLADEVAAFEGSEAREMEVKPL
jgi:predicted transcriptional regulator